MVKEKSTVYLDMNSKVPLLGTRKYNTERFKLVGCYFHSLCPSTRSFRIFKRRKSCIRVPQDQFSSELRCNPLFLNVDETIRNISFALGDPAFMVD